MCPRSLALQRTFPPGYRPIPRRSFTSSPKASGQILKFERDQRARPIEGSVELKRVENLFFFTTFYIFAPLFHCSCVEFFCMVEDWSSRGGPAMISAKSSSRPEKFFCFLHIINGSACTNCKSIIIYPRKYISMTKKKFLTLGDLTTRGRTRR